MPTGLPQEDSYDPILRHALDVDGTGDRLAFGSTTGNLWISVDQGEAPTLALLLGGDVGAVPVPGPRYLERYSPSTVYGGMDRDELVPKKGKAVRMIYGGDPLGSGDVQLGAATDLFPGSDESEHSRWYERARRGDDIIYFGIWESGRQVGQIFLHDINWTNAGSLVGYHLFDVADRGRKIGTLSLPPCRIRHTG
jgi:hypothetical protein